MTAGGAEVDPELSRLLLQELKRHLDVLERSPLDHEVSQRAVHALKGSAGLAGQPELAATFERLHRRLKEGDESALEQAATAVRTAVERMAVGDPPLVALWPVPPMDLAARPIDPLVFAQYAAEVSDRLSRIDAALVPSDDPVESARALFRHVHSLKGAASAVGDEPMSWFCHGLEDKLSGLTTVEGAMTGIEEVVRWRVVLGGLVEEPDTALAGLRAELRPSQAPRPAVTTAPPTRPIESEPPRTFEEPGATVRVAAASIDRLLQRFDSIDVVREGLAARAARTREAALTIRDLRVSLVEALRLIGPPRPWGAPAAALRDIEHATSQLGSVGDDLDAASARLLATEHGLRDDIADAKKQLSTMRRTTVGRIFARLTTAIESEARRIGRAVIVRTRGADETIDRRIAEMLVEPGLQLVRNAVAHGIEPPEVRTSLAKPATGTILLGARKLGNRLSMTIEDDGAGVDVANVRQRAVDAGLIAPAIADATDDDTLLSLLFVPGFSTRESTDLLAGRGVGLEIARSVTQRMGGAIRLSSRVGEWFRARIDVPMESGLATVLWVLAGEHEFGLPAAQARRVRKVSGDLAEHPPHLLSFFDPSSCASAAYAVELDLQGEGEHKSTVAIGVDGVRETEELLVRSVGPLVSGLGPFAGAIVRGDGSLRLALDPWAIAPRARAMAAAHASGYATPPSR